MNKPLVLVVEDDRPVRNLIVTTLKAHDYRYLTAENGHSAIIEATSHNPDIVLLDLGLPDIDGTQVIENIRSWSNMPIIVISARSEDKDKITALDAGADDYLTKPFSNAELLMRVKAQLRRSQQYQAQMVQQSTSAPSTALTLYDLTLDPDSQSVSKNGQVIILTHTEFKILELFLSHHKKIFSIDNIYQSVWEDNAVGDSTVMVHIKNLRKKLGDSTKNPKYIKTAWGKGYYVD